MSAAREIEIADDPERWGAVGFAVDEHGCIALDGLALRANGGAAPALTLVLDAEPAGAADGLPLRGGGAAAPALAVHPNGALAVDHLVAFTDDRDRTADALAAAGGDVRRRGEPPELPARMAFVRFGPLIVEVAEAGGPPRFWGLTVTVADVDAAARVTGGEPRAAVQPGRRILTVPRSAGLAVALALISPR